MENKSYLKIQKKTQRIETECDCQQCRQMCSKQVCLGTPQDIMKLIDAGYKDKLKLTYWMVAKILGKLKIPIPMVQLIQGEDGCVFFKNGICELHDKDLKPLEGRLAHHNVGVDNIIFENSISWNVAREWILEENFNVVLEIFVLMEVLTEQEKAVYSTHLKSGMDK